MTDQRTNNCTICILVPLILGIGALLFFYFTSRDSIANTIQNDLAFKSNQLLKDQLVGNVTVTMHGRDALLKGTVVSQERSQEIENIVAAMSGIRVVDNQLEIAKKIAVVEETKQKATQKPEPLPEIDPKQKPEIEIAAKHVDETAQTQVVGELLQSLDLSGITFLFGKDEITEQGKRILDEVTNILTEHTEFNVSINGYTDSVGDEELNLQLSQQRAQSVLNYLTNNGIQ